MIRKILISLTALLALAIFVPSKALGWGACHSSSTSWGGGSWNHSGSTTWTGRYGNTYTTSHSGSGSYYGGYHSGSGSWSGPHASGSYHYGGYGYPGCYGGGFHAGYVSTPYGSAYHAGYYRRW